MRNPKVWLESDGILRIDYGHYGQITLDAIKNAYEQHVKLSTKKRPVLVYASTVVRYEREATSFLWSDEICKVTSATAIITQSFLAKHLGQLFMWYHKPPYPARLFSSEAEAIRWLENFKDDD